MVTTAYNNPAPGIRTGSETSHRQVLLKDEKFLPGLHIIDGSKSRDATNTPTTILRPGLLLGRITASKKLAPALIGVTGVLHDTSEVTTTMTLPAAVISEIQRRIGSSGTFKITGPPTAAGTNATETVTFSAIASATTLTITATSADFAAGSIITPTDGSEVPVTFIPDGYGISVVDDSGEARDVDLQRYPIGGLVDSSQLLPWPADASVRAYIVASLKAAGNFVFDHLHGQ